MNDTALSSSALALREYLRSCCRGKENAQLARVIGQRLDPPLREGQVSDAGRELRLAGEPVGTGQTGFFWMVTYEEAVTVDQDLLGKACAIHETRSALRRAFPKLPPIGQRQMTY